MLLAKSKKMKAKKGNTIMHRGKKRPAVFGMAASIALLSVSSLAIRNRNRKIWDEAQATWKMVKLLSISFEGQEEEVVSRIVDLEELDRFRYKEKNSS